MKRKQTIALELAAMGLRIIPVQPNGKKPAIIGWQEKASSDVATINEWFAEWPEMNYGVLCGEQVDVLDLDIKPGKNGVEAFAAICGSGVLDDLNNTLKVETPSAGVHYYLHAALNATTVHRHDGIDYQSRKAFVVGPGSAIDGKEYRITSQTNQIAVALDVEQLTRLGVFGTDDQLNNGIPSEIDGDVSRPDSHLLSRINPDLPYDDWRDAIFAFLNLGGEHEALRDWSWQGRQWDEGMFWKVVNSFNPGHPKKLGHRRLVELAKAYPVVRTVKLPQAEGDVSALRQSVLDEVIRLLEKYGNRPVDEHVRGLESIVDAMVSGCYSDDKFRLSFPLETGMGKTTCVIALIKCLQHTDRTVLVCAEQIDQLQDLREALLGEGVEPSKVGIYHNSDRHKESVPAVAVGDLPSVQFLLASHNRVKSETARAAADKLLNVVKNGTETKRSLVVWDESLISTRPIYVERSELRREINNWMIQHEERMQQKHKAHAEVAHELYDFMRAVAEELRSTVDDASCYYEFARTFGLGRATGDYMSLVDSDVLKNLLRFHANGKVRQLSVSSGRVLVQFVAEVDDSFDKIVILDASARIRDLVVFDKSIQQVEIPLTKDYSNVTVLHANVSSSKKAMTDQKHFRSLLHELLVILESLPKNEKALVFCFKDYEDEIRKYVEEQHPFRNVHLLHWGQHRGSNRYAEVKHMVTVGVLYRDTKEIASALLAQSRNLGVMLHPGDIRRAELGEQADLLYQAISRGHSRKTFDGRAGEQTVYLLHPDRECKEVLAILKSQMKGLRVERYIPRIVKTVRFDPDEPIVVLGDDIADFLGSLPDSEREVSQRKLRKAIGADKLSSNSHLWRSAKKRALDYSPQFEERGRSFVRR